MAQLSVERACNLADSARAKKDRWWSQNSETFDYVFPNRSDYDDPERGQAVDGFVSNPARRRSNDGIYAAGH